MKNIKIPEEVFYNLVKYFLFDDEKLHDEIKTELENKLNKLVERELYSTYCTAATPAERENARKKYLDAKGIPEAFRW
jgi:hypothetical protein